MSLREVVEDWIKTQGSKNLEYDLIIASSVVKYPLRELLFHSKVRVILLPEFVWERNKIYFENVSARKVAYFE